MNNKYDYVKAMTEDIINYVNDNITLSDYDNKDDLFEALNDDMWAEDEITGNGCYGYDDNDVVKQYVSDNADLLREALQEFCTPFDEIAKRFLDGDYKYFDCTIRCYVLGWAIDEAIKQLDVNFDNE